jgi:hypothetical protein
MLGFIAGIVSYVATGKLFFGILWHLIDNDRTFVYNY